MKPVLGTITENKGKILGEELISKGLVWGFCGKTLAMSCHPPAHGDSSMSFPSAMCWSPLLG